MPITISQKGWVVIPAKLRKKYNLRPGAKVHIVDYGGVLTLIPALEDPIRQAAGMLSKPTGANPLTQVLLEEHADELEHE
ncbi:MAG: AbrB/MazE/SpoVT family DNA-binding domain-containing protein [Anaerolineaceae bacterium]|nr:AbrB/MazE/SpoVT family DNA-binding domain-containing protein [Anaerolineaceae bacterium]